MKKFLLMSPRAKQILPILQRYVFTTGEKFDLSIENYQIFYSGEMTESRENELRMFCLGVYCTLLPR